MWVTGAMDYLAFLFCLATITGSVHSARESWPVNEYWPFPTDDNSSIDLKILYNKSFSYARAGADWAGTCKTGKLQSPIVFPKHGKSFCKKDPKQPLYFNNYDDLTVFAVMGLYSLYLIVEPVKRGLAVGVVAGKLPGYYEFHSAHLHFPSEHIITPKSTVRHALEIQFVHYNLKYKTLAAAIKSQIPDSLAVVSVLYDKGAPEPHWQPAVEHATLLRKPDLELIPRKFMLTKNLSSLLPDNYGVYLRYRGSLTVPPCSENVIWTIMLTTKTISDAQLRAIQFLQLAGKKAPETFRDFQESNGRKITKSSSSSSKIDLGILLLIYWIAIRQIIMSHRME